MDSRTLNDYLEQARDADIDDVCDLIIENVVLRVAIYILLNYQHAHNIDDAYYPGHTIANIDKILKCASLDELDFNGNNFHKDLLDSLTLVVEGPRTKNQEELLQKLKSAQKSKGEKNMNNDFTGPKLPQTIRIDDEVIINPNNVISIYTEDRSSEEGVGRTLLYVDTVQHRLSYIISNNDGSEINMRAKVFADYLGLQYKEWV